jgi:adenylate cyclase
MLTTSTYSTTGIPLIPVPLSPGAAETTCATVLSVDLRGYDVLAEKLSPAQVVSLLGEFFTVLTGAVLESGGQIFRMAEADMMAGFGVGDSRHTQIREAMIAARTIQQRFAPIRASWQNLYAIDAGIGIGVHRGEVAIGVFGPSECAALTLVGDTAHVASLLCRRARAGEVLLSAAVHLPNEPMPLLHLPQLHLRGRSAPLDVWCAPVETRLQMRHAERAGRTARH